MFANGAVIDQKYFVRGLCSNAGGMGTVLFVHHVQRADALLVLKYCKHGDEEMLRRFQREVRVMQSFSGNDAVAQILDANLSHRPPYFVMPFFENGDVSQHAEFIRARADMTELYFMRMIDCIEQLHMRNIFHRDIKPQNFLLGGGNLVVSDLGLCTQLDSSTMFTRQSVWAGTPGYIPPEFLEIGGFRNADARSDVFMLGATFRNILAAGGAKLPEKEVCFYDAAGVTRESTADIRVWTKCLRQKELDSIDAKSEVGKTITRNAARKLAHGYVPPITAVENLNADQGIDITLYELKSDIGDLQPQASIFYELNCSARMMRELSMSFISRGTRSFTDKPTDWKYVPPEGNVARLLKMLCPGQ